MDATLGPWVDSLESLVDAVASGEVPAFRTLYADPPWDYDNRATRNSAARQYKTMSIDELRAMPVEKLAGSKSLLWLWTTVGFRDKASDLARTWGFTLKSEMV